MFCEKKHICNVCGKTFNTGANLILHIQEGCSSMILPESGFEFPIKEEKPVDLGVDMD